MVSILSSGEDFLLKELVLCVFICRTFQKWKKNKRQCHNEKNYQNGVESIKYETKTIASLRKNL